MTTGIVTPLRVAATTGALSSKTQSPPGSVAVSGSAVVADAAPQDADASVKSQSPWSMDYEPVAMRAPSQPTMRDVTFTYLWAQKVYRPASGPLATLPSLRWLAKNFSPKVLQEGPKCKLVCRLMLRMEHIVKSGHGTWASAFEPHRSNYYQVLRSKFIVRAMFVAPSHADLLQRMPEGRERVRHDRDGKRAIQLAALDAATANGNGNVNTIYNKSEENPIAENPTSSPAEKIQTNPTFDDHLVAVNYNAQQLTPSEFARLVAVIVQTEASMNAAEGSTGWNLGLPDIWRNDGIIVQKFHDPNFRPVVDVGEVLGSTGAGAINATRSPVPGKRIDGIALCKAYETARLLFSRAHGSWSADRLSYTSADANLTARGPPGSASFVCYVNRAASTKKLGAIGTHACIIFCALRCGRQDEMTGISRVIAMTGAVAPSPQQVAEGRTVIIVNNQPGPQAISVPVSSPTQQPVSAQRGVKRRRGIAEDVIDAAKAEAAITKANAVAVSADGGHAVFEDYNMNINSNSDANVTAGDNCNGGTMNACCIQSLEKVVSVAISSAVAAVLKSVPPQKKEKSDIDIVSTINTLRKECFRIIYYIRNASQLVKILCTKMFTLSSLVS